jgi:nicotinate-nucleotide adenylyltransferase
VNNKKIRVGILGGSFNPPHSGHLSISEQAIKKLNLKQMWWIVSPQNPLKNQNIKSSFEQRIKLCQELTKNNPKIKISDIEYRLFKHSKKFYSYDLLKRLSEKFKNYEFYFIIGADNLINFHKWHRHKELAKLANIVVFDRPSYKYKAKNSITAKSGIPYKFINGKTVDISSTELRGD